MASISSRPRVDRASSSSSMITSSSSYPGGAFNHDGSVGCRNANKLSSSMDFIANDNKCMSMEDVLPNALLGEIFSHLVDAKDLSRAALVNSSFRKQCRYTKNVRFNCQLKNVFKKSAQDGEAPAAPVTPFKQTVTSMIKNFECVNTLRLEIEEDVQAKRFKEDEVDKTSLWLSEGSFVRNWLPPVCETLTSLTLIDYGHQAIYHPSPLLPLLSQHCKQLQKLELRNMFLDSKSCSKMPRLTRLNLKCVKLMENGLQDISEMMPMLQSIILESVVGLREARLKSDRVKVLCLTCITRVNAVKLESSSLKVLQLKMQCPDEIRVKAPSLETLTIRMTRRPGSVIEFETVRKLKELLMGANEMSILKKLSSVNRFLEKVYLDIPCMIYEHGSGSWRGVRSDNLPPSSSIWESLKTCCRGLHSLSAGPGFWYCLEQGINDRVAAENQRRIGEDDASAMVVDQEQTYLEQVQVAVGAEVVQQWSTMKRLILHMVIQDAELSFGLLSALLRAMPSLETLEVYVHKDSKVQAHDFSRSLNELFPHLKLTCDSWSKQLKFDCFTQPETYM